MPTLIYIIYALYLMIILMYVLINVFIAYHFFKYSFRPETKIGSAVFFLGISALLLISDLTIFFSIRWQDLFINIFS